MEKNKASEMFQKMIDTELKNHEKAFYAEMVLPKDLKVTTTDPEIIDKALSMITGTEEELDAIEKYMELAGSLEAMPFALEITINPILVDHISWVLAIMSIINEDGDEDKPIIDMAKERRKSIDKMIEGWVKNGNRRR